MTYLAVLNTIKEELWYKTREECGNCENNRTCKKLKGYCWKIIKEAAEDLDYQQEINHEIS